MLGGGGATWTIASSSLSKCSVWGIPDGRRSRRRITKKCELGEQQRTRSTAVPLLLAVATRSSISSAFVTAADGAGGLDVLDGYSASVIKCRCTVTGADQYLARLTVGQGFMLPRAWQRGRPHAVCGARRDGAGFGQGGRDALSMLPKEPSSIFMPLTTFCGEIALAWTRRHVRSVRAQAGVPHCVRNVALLRTEQHATRPGACARSRGIRSAAAAKSSRSAAPTTSPCARPFPAHTALTIISFSSWTWSPRKLASLIHRPGTTPGTAKHNLAGGSRRAHNPCIPPSLTRP